jgi:predicted lipoprotein with Yx(FWY)xxD motif
MRRIGLLTAALAVAVAAAIVAAVLATNGSAKTSAVVKTMHNSALGKTILVNRSGLTLYSLSAERHGRFICTNSFCLSLWKPLVVPAGVKPTGVTGLTVVKRPTGQRQVAFRGAPLYRFVQDSKPGQVKGNGFRDVGVWRPVTTGASAAQAPAPAPANTGSSSNPYSY